MHETIVVFNRIKIKDKWWKIIIKTWVNLRIKLIETTAIN